MLLTTHLQIRFLAFSLPTVNFLFLSHSPIIPLSFSVFIGSRIKSMSVFFFSSHVLYYSLSFFLFFNRLEPSVERSCIPFHPRYDNGWVDNSIVLFSHQSRTEYVSSTCHHLVWGSLHVHGHLWIPFDFRLHTSSLMHRPTNSVIPMFRPNRYSKSRIYP